MLARYPDDLEAWVQLGEVLFHLGPVHGRPVHASEEPWRRVLEHEPRNLFALPHLARLAAVRGDISALDSLLTPFSLEERRTDRRLTEVELHRALAAADTIGIRALTQEVRGWDGLAVWRVGAWLTAFGQDPSSSRAVLQQLNAGHFPPEVQSDLRWFESLLRLAEGRLGPAQSALEEAVRLEARAEDADRRAGFEPVTRWYAAALPLPYPDSTLARMRGDVENWTPRPPEVENPFVSVVGLGQSLLLGPLRHYALGLLSLRLGDRSGAETASRELGELAAGGNDSFVRDLDRGLRARILRSEGRPEEALELLEELEVGAPQGIWL